MVGGGKNLVSALERRRFGAGLADWEKVVKPFAPSHSCQPRI
jgi:hypothetical protein